MNIVKVEDLEGMLPEERNKFYGKQGQIEIIGSKGKIGRTKRYIVKCNICSQDHELFGEGLFATIINRLNNGNVPCGCSNVPKWSEDQFKVLCQRRAESEGFCFYGWSSEYKGQDTNLRLYCIKHNHAWDITSISNFICHVGGGCNYCRYEKIAKAKTTEDSSFIKTFMDTGAFPAQTLFTRLEGNERRWTIYCPECKQSVDAYVTNLRKGCRPCGCGRKAQTKAYINLVYEDDICIAVKFGVSVNPNRRLYEHIKGTGYTVIHYGVWEFGSIGECKAAEKQCKSLQTEPQLRQYEFVNGYTETVSPFNLEQVISIYESFGGEKQPI